MVIRSKLSPRFIMSTRCRFTSRARQDFAARLWPLDMTS